MYSRCLVLFLVCLGGGARRSIRINDSHQDAQQRKNTLASGLGASDEARETLLPEGLRTSVFRRAAPRAAALSKAPKYRVASSALSGPRRSKDNLMALRPSLQDAGADMETAQIEDAMWSVQNMLRDLVDTPKMIRSILKGSPTAEDSVQTAMIDDPEQQKKDVDMMKDVARLVENSLDKGMRDEATKQVFTTQVHGALKRANQLIHDPELTNLLEQAQHIVDADAPARHTNRAGFVPAAPVPRTVPAMMQDKGDSEADAEAEPDVVSEAEAGAESKDLPVADGMQDLKSLAASLNPVIGYWDPLNLAEIDFWEQGQDATIGFLRHSEIKHGRVAMAAFVGYIVQANGIHFPWKSTLSGITYADIAAAGGPAAQWDALPTAAKLQIILFVGFLEGWSENKYALEASGQAHYMRGGKPGAFPPLKQSTNPLLVEWTPSAWKTTIPHPIPLEFFDPFGFQRSKSDEWKSKKLLAEINNGRLAMLGIMAFLAESKIPGAVPVLSGLGIQPYSGEVMAPFGGTPLAPP